MPHSVPASKLMIPRSEWPQIPADADVLSAIKLLRIVSEDEKLEHGHSTPLIMDEQYNLLGFVHLADLLKSVRHLWAGIGTSSETERRLPRLRNLVVPFAGSVQPEDSILKALDVMTEHTVSIVPVMKDGKLKGMIKLSDIFSEVAALIFDEARENEDS